MIIRFFTQTIICISKEECGSKTYLGTDYKNEIMSCKNNVRQVNIEEKLLIIMPLQALKCDEEEANPRM
jgi:hypothetical protein